MNRDHLLLGTTGSFILGLALLFGAKHLGPLAGVGALLGVGFFVLSMIGLVAYRIARVVSFFKR